MATRIGHLQALITALLLLPSCTVFADAATGAAAVSHSFDGGISFQDAGSIELLDDQGTQLAATYARDVPDAVQLKSLRALVEQDGCGCCGCCCCTAPHCSRAATATGPALAAARLFLTLAGFTCGVWRCRASCLCSLHCVRHVQHSTMGSWRPACGSTPAAACRLLRWHCHQGMVCHAARQLRLPRWMPELSRQRCCVLWWMCARRHSRRLSQTGHLLACWLALMHLPQVPDCRCFCNCCCCCLFEAS